MKFDSVFVICLLPMMFANLDLSDGGANPLLFLTGAVSGFEDCNRLRVVESLIGGRWCIIYFKSRGI